MYRVHKVDLFAIMVVLHSQSCLSHNPPPIIKTRFHWQFPHTMSKEVATKSTSVDQTDLYADEQVSSVRVFLFTIFVAFGGFLFGYDCIIGGPLLETWKFKQDFGFAQADGSKGFSPDVKGLFISILSIGTFCGALTAPFLCDRFGRRIGLLLTCGIFTAGIVCQVIAGHLAILMIGRWIAGVGVGCVSLMVPLYQSECVPAKRRGTIVSCYQLAITIGLLIGQIVLACTETMTGAASYRIPIGLQFVWSTVLAIGLLLLPETPRWLIRVGRWEDAVRAKVKLTGLPANHPTVQAELTEVKANLDHELSLGPASYKQCWQGTNLRRTLLGIFMQAWQQCTQISHVAQLIIVTGVNFIFYYGVSFFVSAGITAPFKVNMILGTVNACMTLPGMYLIERVGRRRLLLWGAALQCISHFLVGIIHVATHGTQPIFTAVFCATFIAAFAASWGPCAWVLTSELFGLKTRAKQMSFAVAGNW